MALLKRSLIEYVKYFSLNMPMLMSGCALLSSIFNKDIKGYIFVTGGLFLMGIGALISSSIGNLVPKEGFNAEACNMFFGDNWGLKYSSPEAHSLFLAYAFTYLTTGMFIHSDYNFPMIAVLILVMISNAYIRTNVLKCGHSIDILIGWSTGLLWGAGLYALMYVIEKKYDNIIPLTYFSGGDGPDKCKLTNRKFKCKKYAVK